MHTVPPALRSTRAGGPGTSPLLRPTVGLAALFLAVWLVVPMASLLALPFGGSPFGTAAEDPLALLNDAPTLADYFFDGTLMEVTVMIAVISVLRWWHVVQFEPTALRPRGFAVVPWITVAVFGAAAIMSIAVTPNPSISLLSLQVIAMSGIVLIEELGWRGVAVAGLRGSRFPEWSVWLITSAGFSLMHLLNLFAGADFAGTLFQLVFTFFLGTACYLARRVGGLWLAFAVHFVNNFAQAVAGAIYDSPLFELVNNIFIVGQLLLALALPATIILLIVEARRARRQTAAAAPATAPATTAVAVSGAE